MVADTRFSCDGLDECVKLWRAAQAAHVGLWALSGKAGRSEETIESTSSAKEKPTAVVELWARKRSNKYHLPTCQWARRIRPENLVKFRSATEARDAGYVPRNVCNPF